MTFGIPQVIFLMYVAASSMVELCLHGKAYEYNHSIWSEILRKVTLTALLVWGGFFG